MKNSQNLKKYAFRVNSRDYIIEGIVVAAEAHSEQDARTKIAEAILTTARDLKLESAKIVCTEKKANKKTI